MRKVAGCLATAAPRPAPRPHPRPAPAQVMAFLKKVAFRGGRILFVSTDPSLVRGDIGEI